MSVKRKIVSIRSWLKRRNEGGGKGPNHGAGSLVRNH